MNSPDPEKLERLIHQTLRDLPAHRAPRSLESRVLAEIGRRAALPWWKQSFAHWPLAARVLFLLASAGLVKLALMASVLAMAGFDSAQFADAFAPQVAWLRTGLAIAEGTREFFGAVFRAIPPLWLYGAVAAIGATYAALFGLGAAAYRTLHARR